MPEGAVKWFNVRKGFGFIANENGPDIFVHYSQIQGQGERSLNEGEIVEYELEDGEVGPRAAKVIKKEQPDSDD